MTNKKIFIMIGVLSLSFIHESQSSIYGGKDDRVLIQKGFKWPSQILEKVGFSAQIPHEKFFLEKSKEKNYLCEDVPFRETLDLSLCGGVLVAPNIILTAKHCIDEQELCDKSDWIFDYRKGRDISKSERYKCKAVYWEEESTQKDYALILLDRAVKGHREIQIQKKGLPLIEGDSVYTIGYPDGRPLTYTGSEPVLSPRLIKRKTPISHSASIHLNDFAFLEDEEEYLITMVEETVTSLYFYTRLDTFHGSSGNPIISGSTNALVGILSGGGGEDYVLTPSAINPEENCLSEKHYPKRSHIYGDALLRVEAISLLEILSDLPKPMLKTSLK